MAGFTASAARRLRAAIAGLGGAELVALGELDGQGRLELVEPGIRQSAGSRLVLPRTPRSGEVAVHNHPSGRLEPSRAELELAASLRELGAGLLIVDDDLERERWVLEPADRRSVPVDRARLHEFFERDLPRVMPGCERRSAQVAMAEAVADALDGDGVAVIEAGTGTGKSLAWLVPCALWAVANDARVVVSTFTRNLQAQVVSEDVPLAQRAGLRFRASALKGRGNYLCRRKLELAVDTDRRVFAPLADWAARTDDGSRQDYGRRLPDRAWEQVRSDTDHSLRARCPHHPECFYYAALRRAAGSHVVVLNHALLLADLMIKSQGGNGILPGFARVVVDEAHHLGDAAATAASTRLTAPAVRRAIAPLLPDRRGRAGALSAIGFYFGRGDPAVAKLAEGLSADLEGTVAELPLRFEQIAADMPAGPAVRITPELEATEEWSERVAPSVREVASDLHEAAAGLAALDRRLQEESPPPVDRIQPVLDVRKAAKRLDQYAAMARAMLETDPAWCRWVEREGERASLHRAPVEAGPLLKAILFDRMRSAVLCSATMTIRGGFQHYRAGHGIDDASEHRFDSPFDYPAQAMLGLPRDLPRPGSPGFAERAGEVLVELLRASRGGAFVLCTSYRLVDELADAVEAELGGRLPVLRQGRGDRARLLRRFREEEGSVLIGTDSFWEGVSVKGRSLRLVVIPRLPFRVPTHPVARARYEAARERGEDPFRACSLPEAVLKLKQGFGRLVRSRTDRGAVVVLDRRLHDMWYGRVFLQSLPAATRVVGPSRLVAQRLGSFLDAAATEHG